MKAKPRSNGSDDLKQAMIDAGLYDGFDSEVEFHGFFADELNPDLKLVVEFYGDAYHCNPRTHSDPDRFIKMIGRTVGDQWKRDRRRLACFYRHGYVVLIVWESDWRRGRRSQIDRIQAAIEKRRTEVVGNEDGQARGVG